MSWTHDPDGPDRCKRKRCPECGRVKVLPAFGDAEYEETCPDCKGD